MSTTSVVTTPRRGLSVCRACDRVPTGLVSEVVTLVLAVGFVLIGFVLAASVVREAGEPMDEEEARSVPGGRAPR